jgi:restriction endonuclease Mrr
MTEEFVTLENDSSNQAQVSREKLKHILVGSPSLVKKTIQVLHTIGYAEIGSWSKPVKAGNLGESGDVLSVLIR